VARQVVPPPVEQVYRPKQKEQVQRMDIDPERTTNQDVIKIGSMDVPIGEDSKIPIVSNNKVVTSNPGVFVAANDHEASGSGSNSKYFLLRWCPLGLTHTQRRKLQCLRFQEKREKEIEKQRDETFNQYKPMVPQGKEWIVKTGSQPSPVRPVVVVGQSDDPETSFGFSSLVLMVCDNKSASGPTLENDENLVHYSSSHRAHEFGHQRDSYVYGWLFALGGGRRASQLWAKGSYFLEA
jgi:hypothetical protein